MLYQILKIIGQFLFKIFFKFKAEGTSSIPSYGGIILAANHLSYLDPVVVGLGSPRKLYFMAKQALFTRPFLGPLIRLLGAFPLQRDGMSKGTLEQAQRLLQDNKALLVFPEGTRSPNGELLPPKLGIGLMAKRVGVDIVPTLIMGTNYALPLRSRMIKLGYPLSVRFGERIRIRDFKELPQNKETYRVIVNRVMTKIRELKKQEEGK